MYNFNFKNIVWYKNIEKSKKFASFCSISPKNSSGIGEYAKIGKSDFSGFKRIYSAKYRKLSLRLNFWYASLNRRIRIWRESCLLRSLQWGYSYALWGVVPHIWELPSARAILLICFVCFFLNSVDSKCRVNWQMCRKRAVLKSPHNTSNVCDDLDSDS